MIPTPFFICTCSIKILKTKRPGVLISAESFRFTYVQENNMKKVKIWSVQITLVTEFYILSVNDVALISMTISENV